MPSKQRPCGNIVIGPLLAPLLAPTLRIQQGGLRTRLSYRSALQVRVHGDNNHWHMLRLDSRTPDTRVWEEFGRKTIV